MKLLKRAFCLLSALLTAALLLLPAAASDYALDTDEAYYQKYSGKGITLNVYNWGEYISVDDGDGQFDVNREFEALTGIKVNYTTFASNEELYAKLKSGGSSYDIIIPSDYMISRMINEGMLEPLNLDNIPNFSLIDPDYTDMEYDPGNHYSVPYTWGTVGIIYNTTLVDEEDDVASWDILWNEKYANNILMFSNSRDAFAIALAKLGYSFNTTDLEKWDEAAELLRRQKPLVQAYVMDEIFDKMGGGEAALAPYYAGDALTMIEDNPDLAFVVPREGTNLFFDAVCIPKGAKNHDAAEMYINFLCESVVAAANIETIGYSSPHSGAKALLDEEVLESPISYPPQEVIAKSQVFTSLPDSVTSYVDSLWSNIMGATNDSPWITPVLMVVALGLSVLINVTRTARKNKSKY